MALRSKPLDPRPLAPTRPISTLIAGLALALAVQAPAHAVPILTVTPNPMDFGSVPVNATSAPQTLTLTNTGTTTLTLATPFTVGPGDFGFHYVDGPNVCANGLTLAPGASCGYFVTLVPLFPGFQGSGALFFSDGGTVDWVVKGFGGPFPVAPVPTLSPWLGGALAAAIAVLAFGAIRRRSREERTWR
jgi:hypothetical protein